jgi:hypothetical protein
MGVGLWRRGVNEISQGEGDGLVNDSLRGEIVVIRTV